MRAAVAVNASPCLDRGALETLELQPLVERLRQLAGSGAGRDVIAITSPSADPDVVRESLARTQEARVALGVAGRQAWSDLPEVDEVLALSRIDGAVLEPDALQAVARFAETCFEVRQALGSLGEAPRIAALAAELVDARDLANAVRRTLLPGGGVADDASPELHSVRRALAAKRVALETVMQDLVSGGAGEQVLQEKLVTTRNERYVLVVKAGQRSQLPGIVHGSSGSGASVFVEPMPAVELNNEIVALADREQREVRRILRGLTARVGERADALAVSRRAAAELDAAQARALLAEELDAVEPEIAEGVEIDLRQARHPLLIPALAEKLGRPMLAGSGPVPVDLRLGPEEPVLVISGPNTGGKTVALKTVGLLAAMAQSGLHVPAALGTRLPVLRRLFADIGDEQSIAESLSTFSGHLAAIVGMTRDLESPALVLLDEVGAGTDPTEGGALAVAVVDWFRHRGALVVATTHHGQMKGWARATEGVGCASFGYDPATWEPTYRLVHGAPGRSLALEMAQRLGLPDEILETARALRDVAQARAEDLLRELEAERAEAQRERARLAEGRRALDAERAALEERARRTEQQRQTRAEGFAKRLEERAERAVREAREAIDAAARRVEETRSSGAAAQRARVRTATAIRQVFATAAEEVAGPRPETPAQPPQPGDAVRVEGLGGVTGQLLRLDGDGAEVEVKGKRLHVAAAALERVARPGRGEPRRRTERSQAPRRRESEVPAEINVIGLTVDEALPRVDKLLDDAALAERTEIRVIHGLGKGRLRAAVGNLLEGHPHVAAFATADPMDGGGGVTVVELHS